jgi:hypothetical protein
VIDSTIIDRLHMLLIDDVMIGPDRRPPDCEPGPMDNTTIKITTIFLRINSETLAAARKNGQSLHHSLHHLRVTFTSTSVCLWNQRLLVVQGLSCDISRSNCLRISGTRVCSSTSEIYGSQSQCFVIYSRKDPRFCRCKSSCQRRR